MAKATSQSQGAFSFFEEIEKIEPRKNTLKPPSQIEVTEKEEAPETSESEDNLQVEKVVSTAPADEKVGQDPTPEADNTDTPARAEGKNTDKKSTRGRKSVREYSLAAEIIEMPDEETLFSKHYYSMGEVTAMFKENHSLIRYWESEFDILKPKKNGKGDRFFRPADVKNLYLIYDLLRRRKFTIEGAREYLKNNKKASEKFTAIQSLEKIKTFFLELKAGL